MSDIPPPPPFSSPPPPPPPLHGGPTAHPPAPPMPGAPPGYTPYNTNPMAAYAKRLGGLAKAIQILMYCLVGASLLSLLVTLGQRAVLQDYLDENASKSEAEDAIGIIALPSSLAGLLQIAVVVLTMIWMYRLASNHRMLGRPNTTWGPGWAIAGWFLPPVLFVIPFLMFRELWKGSAPGSVANDPQWKNNPVDPIVNIWWLLYGVAGIVVAVLQFSSFGIGNDVVDAAEFYVDSTGWIVLSTAVSAAAAVAYALLVRRLTARQQELVGTS